MNTYLFTQYIRELKNFEAEPPHQHAVYYTYVLLAQKAWTHAELLDVTDGTLDQASRENLLTTILVHAELTKDRVQEMIPQLLSRMHTECLVHGNFTRQVDTLVNLGS